MNFEKNTGKLLALKDVFMAGSEKPMSDMLLEELITEMATRLEAVSYTHLDVYKRQPPTLQSATSKLKNGLHITTYGEYDADGNKVRNPSALPWERNNFNGAFEMKSENGNFGIRIEVQRGRNNPF